MRKKYKIGYLPASFDIFHVGHLRAIKKAKNKCEFLIIGLLSDSAILHYKSNIPIFPFAERKEILKELKSVDCVAVQKSLNPYLNLMKYGVNVMFSGDGFEAIEEIAAKNAGVVLAKFSYCKKQSTTDIKNEIIKQYENSRNCTC